ncbi:MAG: hypothetical protein ACOWYE_12575 [Desulfatiglandales bacterium]
MDVLMGYGWIEGACVFFLIAGPVCLLGLHRSRSRKVVKTSLSLRCGEDGRLPKECEPYCIYLIRYLESLISSHRLSPEHLESLRFNIDLLEQMIEKGTFPCWLVESNQLRDQDTVARVSAKGQKAEINPAMNFRNLMLKLTLNPFERLTSRT